MCTDVPNIIPSLSYAAASFLIAEAVFRHVDATTPLDGKTKIKIFWQHIAAALFLILVPLLGRLTTRILIQPVISPTALNFEGAVFDTTQSSTPLQPPPRPAPLPESDYFSPDILMEILAYFAILLAVTALLMFFTRFVASLAGRIHRQKQELRKEGDEGAPLKILIIYGLVALLITALAGEVLFGFGGGGIFLTSMIVCGFTASCLKRHLAKPESCSARTVAILHLLPTALLLPIIIF